jgi:methylamine utilization protein MauE
MNPALLLADPVAAGAIVGALALILFAAAWHKLSEPDVFAGALQAYALLPSSVVPAATRVLPVLEIGIGAAILVPLSRTPGLMLAVALLLVYAAAMGVNLLRGRREIDCGCGGEVHPLSWGLVLRNAILACAALAVSGPSLARDFDWLDGMTLLVGVLAFYALYLLFDELLRQFSRIAQLRAREQ